MPGLRSRDRHRVARGISPETIIDELEASGALILTSQSSAIGLADIAVTAIASPEN